MGVSLWLVPRAKIPFVNEVQVLITTTIPSHFTSKLKEKHNFTPHVTLTSDIDPSKTYETSSPQEWLDSLTLPEFKKEVDEVILELDSVEAGDDFFRKLTIAISTNPNLTKLAAQTRLEAVVNSSSSTSDSNTQNGDGKAEAQRWAEKDFHPHLSLMYADLPREDVKNKIPLIELQIGWGLGSLFACCGGTLSQGAFLVLVDTSKPVAEWKEMASRELPYVMWRMSRNLA